MEQRRRGRPILHINAAFQKLLLGFKGIDTHGLKAFRREALLQTVDRCVVDKDLFGSDVGLYRERRSSGACFAADRYADKTMSLQTATL